MTRIFARKAYLPSGWADNVRVHIAAGCIAQLAAESEVAATDVRVDIAIPGIPNAHSHAFQRALVGRAESRSPKGKDNFWSWRSRMYELANSVTTKQLTVIATQLYSEMLAAGYTTVAEFHYLHRDENGDIQGDSMLRALITAAERSGINLTYVPVHYERAGFDGSKPGVEQARFAMSVDKFIDHYERAKSLQTSAFKVAIGAHSLRAVGRQSLDRIVDVADRDGSSIHLHIAEQAAEVEQCIDEYGKRPVAWLLDEYSVNERWCLVHATHISVDESTALAQSGAVVCICPTTEANLGDGLFPLQPFLNDGGRIAIGSDSQASVNPFEELRWLEYGQRLVSQSRNVAAISNEQTGISLFDAVQSGGAMACRNRSGELSIGNTADIVCLNEADAMLTGHCSATLLDAMIFSGLPLPIERVMANGQWQVVDGRHTQADQSRADYARVVGELCGDES